MSATLSAPARFELTVRHSRFLAQAWPIDSADHAMTVLADVARTPATHHCWAWRLGEAYRSSDDGEPAGTAGRPILAAIDGQGLDRVVVVVTRWYGGINLGAGGLVRAYGGSTAACLRTAARTPLVAMAALTLGFDYADTGPVRAALDASEAVAGAAAFDAAGTRLPIEVPAAALPALKQRLRDATRDRVRFHAP